MPRTCTICCHADLPAINEALVSGESYRHIASRFDTSTAALQRHKGDHLPAELALAHEAQDVAAADNLLAQVRDLQARALTILGKAEGTGDLRTALGAIREARSNLELLAKLVGELDERPTVNVLLAPEWVTLRATILGALASFPDARAAVASRLVGLEATNGHRN